MSVKSYSVRYLCLYSATCLIFGLQTACAISGRIISGDIASIDETKHQVSVRMKERDNPFGNGHFCGGTAITHKTILTAAHCLFGAYVFITPRLLFPHEVSVVMGSTKRTQKTPDTLIFDIKEMDFHRKYRSGTIQNDIALLFLDGEIPAGHPTAQPIPLASSSPEEGKNCRVSGWGRVSPKGALPDDLLIITVTVRSESSCKASYASTIFASIRKGMFCASGENGKDSCKGDSGGPLVCDNEVAGIVSWGIECGNKGYPGVYTDVYYYRDWILENGAYSINHDFFIYIKIVSLLSLLLIVRQHWYLKE